MISIAGPGWAYFLREVEVFGGDVQLATSFPNKFLSAACALLVLCALASAKSSEKTSAPAKKSVVKPGTASAQKSSPKGKKSKKKASRRSRGQQKIDAKRTLEIQEALIREHYLQGKPSGAWDSATQKALQRYQADHGWQSKTVPDSRALIKLGLGPDHDHLLNPETAMTAHPAADSAAAKPAAGPDTPPQK